MKKDIKDFTLPELKREIAALGEPGYRAGQVFDWVFRKGILDFDSMANIPTRLKEKLKSMYVLALPELSERLVSKDGSEKFLFRLADGRFIETVAIPSGPRNTVCLSSQVGCKFACAFCASGLKGFKRNLTPSEIVGQLLFLRHTHNLEITNVVFMGMGEPLDNYDNVAKAILIINSPQGLNIAARRITVSTCGVIPGIERFRELGLQVELSVSLHTADDKLRDTLLPVNRKYPLEKLIRVLEEFIEAGGRKITLEYVLLQGVNDSPADASALASLARRLKAKVNLIPYSPVPGLDFKAPSRTSIDIFLKKLEKLKVNATLRQSKGQDIQAACGQLAGRLHE